MKILAMFLILATALSLRARAAETNRTMRFAATTSRDAIRWQHDAREKLFALMMGGGKPKSVPLDAKVIQRIEMPAGGYVLEEVSLQTLPDRRVHTWMAVPKDRRKKVGAVLALHGHSGTGSQIVRGESLYWYGRALAEMGYVVISPDIGQHELQHTNWTLMGERVWDALRCIDYLETRPEVDKKRIAVAGLSLGGETTMYVAAMDPRIKAACSSGWLTTIDNMKRGHCPCWNFPRLEEHFDFADIFACVAPRPLVLEIGEKERAPGGFPVDIARKAFAEIQPAYRVFRAEKDLLLDIHPSGHVFHGAYFWNPLREKIGVAWPWSPRTRPADTLSPSDGERDGVRGKAFTDELLRRGEIARRNFCRALGVLDGWWATRDPESGLYPRRVDQPVWAPQDNAADMFPFLSLTAYFLAPERLDEILQIIPKEKRLTDHLGVLPDWYSITNRAFVYTNADLPRLVFNAAEYCKDGLIPMTEVMGRGPWVDRMIELTDAIFERAAIKSDFGTLPADDTEVNGDVLQTLARVYAMTREKKYLAWAERIVDAYCFEVLPKNGGLPAYRWDFTKHEAIKDSLNLNDHGNELIGGLAELYVITKEFDAEKAARYREPLAAMFHRLLAKARNEDGLWYNLIRSSTGESLNKETPDTWGYALSATAAFGAATGDNPMLAAVKEALHNIDKPRYLDWNGADAYADSIEGATYLLNRFPTREGFDWLEKVLPIFLGKQRENGIVEGWYGDGNYARTALLVARFYTQGTICRPWRPDLRFGTARAGDGLVMALRAEKDWQGNIVFDQPRHRLNLRLPVNYPRLNEWSEWFTVEADRRYRVRMDRARPETIVGAQMLRGLPLQVRAGEVRWIEITAN
ncbi:MAG: acetylxylan esterase [Verrucomicrobia bacterium]|nr:acetylxylan esterase [Verrucomicrobiota bacterium]